MKQIQAPVLFAWGGQDDRIDPADGHRFVEALQREGKVHRSIFEADEGHGFESPANVEEFFGAVEGFVAEHLRISGQ
ncbi:MAG: prolyl oligopeptidase family serine peptidase [Verrucomicrobia bacterium]|nr:prolyl oligopeptidase family serine peptidase [Verrucomicrobiota bacterium]